ncbi:hypothetical protein, partial [Escherichia coli]|uniref:hypothetical protein n=2 Tax=Enterobacteriaceae TaxID=543 RepID=UPI003CE453B7
QGRGRSWLGAHGASVQMGPTRLAIHVGRGMQAVSLADVKHSKSRLKIDQIDVKYFSHKRHG